MDDKIEIVLTVSRAEYVALSETADLNNDGVTAWVKRVALNATFTNDEKRFAIRKEIQERLFRSGA